MGDLCGLFAAQFLVRHIHDSRFRYTAVTATSNEPQFPDPDREVARDFHSRARRTNRFSSRRNRA